MGCIFYLMGKSASGKDTIYRRLLDSLALSLHRVVPYTTRPIREGEADGREYRFCDEAALSAYASQGRIIELREYHTVCGIWKYFTVDDEQIDLAAEDYLMIGTLEGYLSIRDHFGSDAVIPIYIEVDDKERLLRAIRREEKEPNPRYDEVCRRFLADAEDFSDDRLGKAMINNKFNNSNLDDTVAQITTFIKRSRHGDPS